MHSHRQVIKTNVSSSRFDRSSEQDVFGDLSSVLGASSARLFSRRAKYSALTIEPERVLNGLKVVDRWTGCFFFET